MSTGKIKGLVPLSSPQKFLDLLIRRFLVFVCLPESDCHICLIQEFFRKMLNKAAFYDEPASPQVDGEDLAENPDCIQSACVTALTYNPVRTLQGLSITQAT